MSNYQQKDGSGVLFKNNNKEKETQPDYKGSILINGVDHWLSAWIKTSDKGKFMSLSVQPKDEQKQAPKPAAKPAGSGFDDMDDDIPF